MTLAPLPIDPLLPEIVAQVRKAPLTLLEGPPGSGKTTRVPPALLDVSSKEVWVLEPRRLAARLAARRVASERCESVGETVGYQVRFEDVSGPRTRIRFITEGVLNRRLMSDPKLERVGVVILDEFHERHLEGDLAFALLRRLQATVRPDLRLALMSATLLGSGLGARLGDCPVIRYEGRLYDVEVSYQPYSPEPLEQQVAKAVERELAQPGGDVLVFLPGAAEIHRTIRACQQTAQRSGVILAPLHGDLSPEEQDRAVNPAERRKVILSTNVAESSVTIEGVRVVIDSGLARIAADSPWSGIPTLKVARISRSSAAQRAGRAGRTGPGRAVRLYPAEEFYRRPEFEAPEIARKELSALTLECAAIGVADLMNLPWLDAPPETAVLSARSLLQQLGALDSGGALTQTGREMSRLPLHPRLGRVAIEAAKLGVLEEGCAIAALLSTGARLPSTAHAPSHSDLLVLLESAPDFATKRLAQQISRSIRSTRSREGSESDLLKAVLTGFPDRVAKRRRGTNELLLSAGGSAQLAENSTVKDIELLVAVEVEERSDQRMPLVRLASGIEADWLLDLFPERLKDQQTLEWNRKDERVEAVSALLYDRIVIDETRGSSPDPEAAADFMAGKILELGLERIIPPDETEALMSRIAFASQHSKVRIPTDEDIRAALAELCYGRRNLREAQAACSDGGFAEALLRRLGKDAPAQMESVAPSRIRLPSGRQAPVHYPAGQTPYVASRLQDFFGLKETPKIANGQVSLLVHLLAPNQRPVQVTADLAGFWQRLYPQVRKELSRRYPRHAWPEFDA